MSPRFLRASWIALCIVSPASAGEVVVSVSGETGGPGEIACALFAKPEGFPLGLSSAALRRGPAGADGEACRFAGVAPGEYAVAVSVLAKGRDTVDKDFLGRPKQPWGVSNNVRPTLRAPTFAEAAFKVSAQGETRVAVSLAK